MVKAAKAYLYFAGVPDFKARFTLILWAGN
jgi:hypothetical protein